MTVSIAMMSMLSALALWSEPAAAVKQRAAYPRRADGATHVSERWALPAFTLPPEPPSTETLVDALDAAYRTSPTLQARRYDLRSTDEDYAIALAELRPTTQLQLSAGYSDILPGRTTQANRPLADRLNSPDNITNNSASAQIIVDQPLYTGGRAAANRDVAAQAIQTGRAQLRGTEGDLFLQVITTYADIRRDSRALIVRGANLKQLEATLEEVKARREAGELTRTDIAQAETQLDLARAQFNAASEQLQQDRAAYAALVGRDPGVLAPEPPLPGFPQSLDAAFTTAQRLNPELGQAIGAERTSRGQIAVAAAQGRPSLSLRGTATVGGQLAPFHAYNEDQTFAGQAVLTIPLTNGGRVGALIAQARDRNATDRLQIEATRRQMVQAIVSAWNGVATAERNVTVGAAQVASARVLDEGTFEEYRAGLRSTFDVLFAHGSLRDAEISLVAAKHDLYVAQAALLRRMGLLEARTLLTGTPLYDPAVNLRHARGRGALPWDGVLRAADSLHRRIPPQRGIEQPPLPIAGPKLVPAQPLPAIDPTSHSPEIPLPGTTGSPAEVRR